MVLFGLGVRALVFVVRGNLTSTGSDQAYSGGGMRSGFGKLHRQNVCVFHLFTGKGFWYFQVQF